MWLHEASGPAILGLPSSKALKLIDINCAVKMTKDRIPGTKQAKGQPPITSREKLETLYPDRFEGIGKFPGEFHITLKDGAQPVVHPPRKYPIHFKEESRGELEKMEALKPQGHQQSHRAH